MRVIAFIEDPDVIKKILKHLGLWDVKRKPQPVANVYPPVIRYLNLICRKLDKNCRYINNGTICWYSSEGRIQHSILPYPASEKGILINEYKCLPDLKDFAAILIGKLIRQIF